MNASEVRQMTPNEIRERISEEMENLTTLRFQHATSQLTDTSRISKLKKDIARMHTILKERELSGVEK